MHKHVTKLFLSWLENTLDTKQEIDDHLQECSHCRAYYEKMTILLDPAAVPRIPKLRPDPYLPLRIAALAKDRKHGSYVPTSPLIRFSVEGAVVLFAIVVGVLLGKVVSAPESDYKATEIISLYQNAISPDDVATQMENVLFPLEGDQQ